jgi:hypothetical protein
MAVPGALANKRASHVVPDLGIPVTKIGRDPDRLGIVCTIPPE